MASAPLTAATAAAATSPARGSPAAGPTRPGADPANPAGTPTTLSRQGLIFEPPLDSSLPTH